MTGVVLLSFATVVASIAATFYLGWMMRGVWEGKCPPLLGEQTNRRRARPDQQCANQQVGR